MFDNLSERLGRTLKNLRGQGRLSEDNISEAMREVRMALLEADVALPVVKDFIEHVRERAIGQEVATSLTPGQVVIKIVHEELVRLMGESATPLSLNVAPPAVILLAGLQGAGKTTTAVKLARHIRDDLKRSVKVVSCDVYRPAAIDQLHAYADQAGIEYLPSDSSQKPLDIARDAVATVRRQGVETLIVDTAGRLHVDEDMMAEVQALNRDLNPAETLFVIDSMMGQDAVKSAEAFNNALPLSGVILTKVDGDARGGAALSVRHVTGKPIKFLGSGEKFDALEAFHPERVASRILGMGDVLSLIEEVERKTDQDKAKKMAAKIKKGGFDLDDFREQINEMNRMGGMSSLLDKLPGTGQLPAGALNQVNDGMFNRLGTIIDSMTQKERRKPDIINGSRKKRIAAGSGTSVQEVNKLLKQFGQMQKTMKRMKRKGGLQKMLQGMGGGGGGLPPGFKP